MHGLNEIKSINASPAAKKEAARLKAAALDTRPAASARAPKDTTKNIDKGIDV